MNPNSKIKDKLSQLFKFSRSNSLRGGNTIKNNDDAINLQEDIYVKSQNKKRMDLKDMIASYNPNLETNITTNGDIYELFFNINKEYTYPFLQFIITLSDNKLVFNQDSKVATFKKLGYKNYKKRGFIVYKLNKQQFMVESKKDNNYVVTIFDIINLKYLFNFKIANYITELFEENKDLIYLYNSNNKRIISPITLYSSGTLSIIIKNENKNSLYNYSYPLYIYDDIDKNKTKKSVLYFMNDCCYIFKKINLTKKAYMDLSRYDSYYDNNILYCKNIKKACITNII